MKLLLIAITASILLVNSVFAGDDLSTRLDLAKKYSNLISIKDEVNASIADLIVQVPVEQRPILRAAMERNIKIDQLQSVSEMALADVFTAEELKAMVAFYKTDEGKAVKEKMATYQERLAPVIGQMIRDAIESYDRQVQ